MKVLIVDDDKNIRGMLGSFLAKVGWTVVAAGSPDEAQGLCDDSVDVVISDIRMENQSGADLLAGIRETYPCLEVILMSGYDEAREMIERMGLKAFAYLKKPFDLAELNRLLLAAVRQRDKALLELRLGESKTGFGSGAADDGAREGLPPLDILPLPLLTLNADLEVTACNRPAAALFSRTPEEMSGRRFCQLVRMGQSCRTGKPGAAAGDCPLYAADSQGEPCVRCGADAFYFVPDSTSGVTLRALCRQLGAQADNQRLLLLEDITNQSEADFREELITRRMVMGEISAVFSHEFNQPLNAISSYLQLLKYRLDEGREIKPEELAVMCQEMLSEVGRINCMIQMARESAAQRREGAPLEAINLRNHYFRFIGLLRGHILRRGIELEEEFPADLPLVAATPVGLGKVFECLLLNAIDAISAAKAAGSGTRGVIRVSAAPQEQEGRPGVRVRVEDNGVGIRPEIRDRLFEPFFSGNDKTARPGLGLTIASGILHGFEGRIELDTEQREGACMSFWLPLPGNENAAG
ncbi:hybrid sensor histidine kinase/response regulator [bacterium]|nr:hybrid sensor histidine kinase/response regulator [bacterium]